MNNYFLILAFLFVSACTDTPQTNNNSNNNDNNKDTCVRGERTCRDDRTLQTCVDGTQFVTIMCHDNETCTNNDCVPGSKSCSDKCDPPDTKCTKKGKVETCADHNNDGCFEFGDPIACEAGSICNPTDGLCKKNTCTDLCTENETKCEETLISTCRRAGNGCLEFAAAKECPDQKACKSGSCEKTTSCDDECEIGKGVCTPGGKLRKCIKGADTCGILDAEEACGSDKECKNGECITKKSCSDLCIVGEKVCVGNDIAPCEKNAMGCLDFISKPCAGGETCKNDGSVVKCVAPAQSGPVVINEIFYDAVGPDVRNGKSPTFIELRGPAGLDISGYIVELRNGSGGATYETYTLAANSKLDGNGFAVLVSDNPDAFLSHALPFFTNVYAIMTSSLQNVDALQNGPDGVVLKDASSTQIDSVGYGKPDPQFFIGEGPCTTRMDCHAAPNTISGHSIGRKNGMDSDDNKADFKIYFPTPGLENSDLIINEVYFNEPGTDSGKETFVELVAPIVGWEDLPLTGYSLHAINGFNGNEYIFEGVNPGIPMDGFNINDAGDDGFVVICNIDKANDTISSLCSVPYEGVDWQNGPDNLVLKYQGEVIDALGYGSFSAGKTFVGEGSAAPFAANKAGKALARWPITNQSHKKDTDDNKNDFFVVDPSPGTTNPLPSP